jgi:acetyl esterase/lipase
MCVEEGATWEIATNPSTMRNLRGLRGWWVGTFGAPTWRSARFGRRPRGPRVRHPALVALASAPPLLLAAALYVHGGGFTLGDRKLRGLGATLANHRSLGSSQRRATGRRM